MVVQFWSFSVSVKNGGGETINNTKIIITL